MSFHPPFASPGLFGVILVSALSISSWAADADHASAGEQFFARKVWPLFEEKCLACHGGDETKIKARYDMRKRDGLFAGGESGESAITPGQPEKSPLFLAVIRIHEEWEPMPPKENDKLTTAQVDLIRQWIATGAAWMDPAKRAAAAVTKAIPTGKDGVTVRTSGGLSPAWDDRPYTVQDIWAWQPISRPPVPQDGLIEPGRIRNPVDAFMQAKLKERGITQLAPVADKRTLVRRAAFDLTGLPPTPEEVSAFVNDDAPDAFSNLVGRLLASPRYGEQQTQHWLDVVRYADTSGFSNDFERPNAWRYRDYVVRAFNSDKPFDRFVTEQLAGDEVNPDEREFRIATGFLRMGPWEHTAMTVATVTRQDFLDDVMHSVGVTFLGQGLRCARCHDHKFDPIPTRDYYRLQAVFASTQFAEPRVPFLDEEAGVASVNAKKAVHSNLQDAREVLQRIRLKNQTAVTEYLQSKEVVRWEDLPKEERPNKGEVGLTKEELTAGKVAQKRVAYFERELRRFEPFAFAVYSGPPNNYTSTKLDQPIPSKRDGVIPMTRILTGGSLASPGAEVRPGVLSAMANADDSLPTDAEGRRLALAKWIVDPKNTLTARVIVNRVWQWHFGHGLVATPNNFGKMGARPSHPELLDWLAIRFVEHGWSFKKLHALIMDSSTYQQASGRSEMADIDKLDARNELLAYFPSRRLAAEEIRDAVLAVTGELNPALGGPGVFPEINWEIAFQPRHIMGSVAPAYLPSPTRAERNRRTLYAFRLRTLSDPMLEVLNRPPSEISCERRDETTVTPQAFALFNSEWMHARSLTFAAFLEKQAGTFTEQLDHAFQRVCARKPTAEETAACKSHYERLLMHHRAAKIEPHPLPSRIERHMVEEMTGEDIRWEEELVGLREYERDLMPWEVSAETRALAEVCLVLLNSNEFLHLR